MRDKLTRSKPLSVKILAVFLLLVALFFAITSVVASAHMATFVSCVGAVGAAGLFSANSRSRHFVYGASAIVALSWIAVIAQLALSGWPVPGVVQSFISLIPGLLLLAVCTGCSILAARYS